MPAVPGQIANHQLRHGDFLDPEMLYFESRRFIGTGSSLIIRTAAQKQRLKSWQDDEQKDGPDHHPAYNDNRKRPLNLAAYGGRKRRWDQTNGPTIRALLRSPKKIHCRRNMSEHPTTRFCRTVLVVTLTSVVRS